MALQIGDLFKRDVQLGEIRVEAEELAASNQWKVVHLHSFIADDAMERWRPSEYSLDDLIFMEEGTLGKDLGMHLMRMSEEQEFIHSIPGMIRFPVNSQMSRQEYVRTRLRHTHDILHVLTGYNTTPFGETALQAFYAGQSMTTLSAIILFKVIASHLKEPTKESMQHIKAMIDGLSKGLEASQYCGLRHLEDDLSLKTEAVRKKLGIKECTSAVWGSSKD